MHPDLRSYLEALDRENELAVVEAPVDPYLEIAEVHRRVIAAGGPALLFRNPVGAGLPVVTNLFGTRRRVEMAFGPRPRRLIEQAARLPEDLLPPSPRALWEKRGLLASLLRVGTVTRRRAPVLERVERPGDLSRLPALTTWPEDGGPFLTLPLVRTEHPESGVPNLGLYRMQVHGPAETGMHFQIGKGGGFHLAACEERGVDLPCTVTLGGPPALILAAVAPLPENVPELLLASLVLGRRLPMARHRLAAHPVPAGAEIVLSGIVPGGVRRPEGPFGDHYGYYSLVHDYPVFRSRTLLRRSDAILPATVVGKPRQEDFYLGDHLQELLSPLFPVAMPGVRDLWSYGETGYHSLAAAVVRESYRREAMVSAFRILGEGQLALTKFLLVTDAPIDLHDFPGVLEHVLARTDPRTDLFVFSNLSMDSLDYTGPVINEGSKGVLLGLGDPVRELARTVPSRLPSAASGAACYCGGCLVLQGPSRAEDPGWPDTVARDDALADWPLVVLVDDVELACRSRSSFLWTVFTRFEPAADLHGREIRLNRNHPCFTPPVVLDARLAPDFPDELFCDEATARRVTNRWREYFPEGVEMGDSDRGHLGGRG